MFLGEADNRQRFDLLLLGEDEYYLSDESVVLNIPRDYGLPDQKYEFLFFINTLSILNYLGKVV
jgi:hypothetical protein